MRHVAAVLPELLARAPVFIWKYRRNVPQTPNMHVVFSFLGPSQKVFPYGCKARIFFTDITHYKGFRFLIVKGCLLGYFKME